jgi:hypothetical protein
VQQHVHNVGGRDLRLDLRHGLHDEVFDESAHV